MNYIDFDYNIYTSVLERGGLTLMFVASVGTGVVTAVAEKIYAVPHDAATMLGFSSGIIAGVFSAYAVANYTSRAQRKKMNSSAQSAMSAAPRA